VGLGLALIGVQRWMTVRPGIEAELDRLGHTTVADASRMLGDAVTKAVAKLASGPAPTPTRPSAAATPA